MSGPLFVVGDVHGCASELRELLELLPITPDATVVFVGDYVDRGPSSREVIEIILELRRSCQVITLMGNHEQMFLEFLAAPRSQAGAMFIYNGGSSTLASYANERGEFLIPPEHRQFLDELRLSYETDDYFFVHAGLPDVALDKLDPSKHGKQMLWIRHPFHVSQFRWGKLIVHGHSPVPEVDVRPGRINVDTGCVYDRMLSAIELTGRRVYSVPRERPLAPTHLRDKTSNRIAVRFQGAIPVIVNRGDDSYIFETVDYSEFGMLMRDKVRATEEVLAQGEPIMGTIGQNAAAPVSFSGRVLRVQRGATGIAYAVQIMRLIRSDEE